MAEVFRAEARAPDGSTSTVVLKRILDHLSGDEQFRTMFVDESRIASTLDHPNIIRLLDLGRDEDGRIFLVLEYIDGADLRALQMRTEEVGAPLSLASVLFVMREVLRALDYAHTHRERDGRLNPIIHRDVSPQNVLVSRTGQVKLLDFGIAKKEGLDSHTSIGMVKGNALYLSPEQASGQPLDGRSDVYQAGLLLLTLACGKHPFEMETLQALVERAQQGRVPRARDFRPDVPEFIDALIEGATTRAPSARFPSAAAFARFIETWAAQERIPLSASSLSRDLEWAFSDPVALTATHSAAGRPAIIADAIGPRSEVSLGTVVGGAKLPGTFQDFLAALAPISQARTPDAEEEITAAFLASSGLGPAPVEDPGERTAISQQLAADPGERTAISRQLPPEPEEEPTELSTVAAAPKKGAEPEPDADQTVRTPAALPLSDAAPTAVLAAHNGAVRALAVAAGAPRAISAGDDGWLRIWDLAAGTLTAERRAHAAGVTACAIRNDGAVALTAGRDRRVVLWTLTDAPEGVALGGQAGVTLAVAVHPDGSQALAGGEDAKLRLWDLTRRRVSGTLSGHEGHVVAAIFFADRLRAASASLDKTIRVWSLDTTDEIACLAEEAAVRVLALTADNGILLAGRDDGALSMWSPDAAQRLHSAPAHNAPITALGLTPDGTRAITGGADGTLAWWDVHRAVVVRHHAAHTGAVTAVAIAPDGEHALSAGEDGAIKGW